MKIPLGKLKALLRYICTNTDPKLLGKTKLMKLLYFIDFGHVKKYGIPITFDKYIHLERGPVPSNILNLVNSVVDNPEEALLSDTIVIKSEPGQLIQNISCIGAFSADDRKYFTEREFGVIEEICRVFKDKNAKYLVEASHNESAWRNTKEPSEIPYAYAAADKDSQVSAEDIQLLVSLK